MWAEEGSSGGRETPTIKLNSFETVRGQIGTEATWVAPLARTMAEQWLCLLNREEPVFSVKLNGWLEAGIQLFKHNSTGQDT